MGGRGGGAKKVGEGVRMYTAMGMVGPNGELIALPGMFREVPSYVELTPAQKANMTTAAQAATSVSNGLSASGSSNVKLTKREGTQLASALIASGMLLGSGSIRTRLYRTARFLGDFGAIKGGPSKIFDRYKRRLTGRLTGKLFQKLFK